MFGVLAAATLMFGSDSAHAESPTIRLRVEWSTDVPAIWSGAVTVEPGGISQPESLGQAPADKGTLAISHGSLMLQRRSPSSHDGMEFSASAPPDATLHLFLRPDSATGDVEPIELRLAELFHKPRVVAANGARPRIIIRRAPDDAITLRFSRPHLVFDPQETLHAAIVLNLLEDRGASEKQVKAQVRWKLYPQGGSRSIADGAFTTSAVVNSSRPTEVPLELRLPGEEGVYLLRLSASGRGFEDLDQHVQLVILEQSPPTRALPPSERIVDSFEPAKGGALRHVSTHAGRSRFESSLEKMWKRGRHESSLPDGKGLETNWQAYRLHAGHVDRPHRLRLQLEKGGRGTVGVCVFENDPAGGLRPIGPDLRWTHTGSGEGDPEILLWPHERDPIVLVHNAESDSEPIIERIELAELGEQLPAIGATPDPLESNAARRLCGPYLARPALAQYFGAPPAFDGESQESYDDWLTFLVAGRRLVESLEMHGANALLLAVAPEGGGLYPSSRLEPSPRFDSGASSSAGRDPVRKDVLELLMRLFDRSNLTLVPELQFTEPLPALERMVRERSSKSAGIRLIDAAGRSWADVHGINARGVPWYNPLDERVQQAVIEVVRELVERYRDHPAFVGVACELNPRGYLQYPGIEWGYDAPTIERFAQTTKVRVPGGSGPEGARERFEYLTTTVRREWLAWRAAEIGRFHSRIAEAVVEASPRARVLLTGSGRGTDLAGRELSASELVRTTSNPTQQLLVRGINFSQAPLAERVTAMRPVWSEMSRDPLDKAALLTLNQSPGIDAAYRGGKPGSLLYSLPLESRIQNCGALLGQKELDLVIPSEAVPDERDLQRHYAHALGTLDSQVIFEGGGMLPVGRSPAAAANIAGMRRAVSRLPATAFQSLAAQTQPATIRTARFDEATWLCLVNSSSLPAVGHLVLGCGAETRCIDLSSDKVVVLRSAGAERSRLEWELGPYAVWCCRIAHPNAAVHDVRAILPGPVLAGLRQQVDRLQNRMNVIADLSRSTGATIQNAGFEEQETKFPSTSGWEVSESQNALSLDDSNPRSGRNALRLTAEGTRAPLISPILPMENARHATLSLWMRSNRSSARVELTLEGRHDERSQLQRQVVETGKNWRKYEFRVNGFAGGQAGPARLRVEPLDSCKLWLDDLEIEVQRISADEVRQLTKTVSAVHLAWEQGRYADCQRLLEGYWGRLLLEDPGSAPAGPVPEGPISTRPRKLLRR